jgi:hypothetical protein
LTRKIGFEILEFEKWKKLISLKKNRTWIEKHLPKPTKKKPDWIGFIDHRLENELFFEIELPETEIQAGKV